MTKVTVGPIRQLKAGQKIDVDERFWQLLASFPVDRIKRFGKVNHIVPA